MRKSVEQLLFEAFTKGTGVRLRETVTTPDYRVKWQVLFRVGQNPECLIATCDTADEAQDEANRFGECLKKLIAAIVKE